MKYWREALGLTNSIPDWASLTQRNTEDHRDTQRRGNVNEALGGDFYRIEAERRREERPQKEFQEMP